MTGEVSHNGHLWEFTSSESSLPSDSSLRLSKACPLGTLGRTALDALGCKIQVTAKTRFRAHTKGIKALGGEKHATTFVSAKQEMIKGGDKFSRSEQVRQAR